MATLINWHKASSGKRARQDKDVYTMLGTYLHKVTLTFMRQDGDDTRYFTCHLTEGELGMLEDYIKRYRAHQAQERTDA